ncbi:hypothetical protein, partial [Desulfitobacterium hafniense]|uniref:glycine-rich domain-containing protein n=1 Tax=Desulfitobacterium hafniense TaxID=49338 RepID=UPI0003635546
DSYANPINGANLTVSGGFGASVSGASNTNGYFSMSVTPTTIGGPFTLHYSVSSPQENYSTNQNTLTVTGPISVPTDKLLEGTTIAGKVGTMPNMAVRNPNGIGVGRSQALSSWTGGGSTVYLKPQKGYYDGNDTWTYFNDPNLVPSNIKKNVTIFGVNGTYGGTAATHGSASWTTPGTYYWAVPDGITTVMVRITSGSGGGGGGQPVINYNGGYTYGGGGGGGSDSYVGMVGVTPGQVVTVVVGAGGIAGTNGYYEYPYNPFGNNPPFGWPAIGGQDGGHSSFAGAIVHGGKGGSPAYHNFGSFYNTKEAGVGGSPGVYGGGAIDIQLGLSLGTIGTAGQLGSYGGGYSVPRDGGNRGLPNGGYGAYDSYRWGSSTNASNGGNGSVYIQW